MCEVTSWVPGFVLSTYVLKKSSNREMTYVSVSSSGFSEAPVASEAP